MSFRILKSDSRYKDSPDVGPECICSRCSEPILSGVPIRAWVEDGECEYRYHPACLGFTVIDGPRDEDGDEDEWEDEEEWEGNVP